MKEKQSIGICAMEIRKTAQDEDSERERILRCEHTEVDSKTEAVGRAVRATRMRE